MLLGVQVLGHEPHFGRIAGVVLDALLELGRRIAPRDAAPLDAGVIRRVVVGTNSYAHRMNGTVLPADTMGAQYSLPYCAALALTAVNMFGGFAVTRRMLAMFRK